jgi:hypothetical protein
VTPQPPLRRALCVTVTVVLLVAGLAVPTLAKLPDRDGDGLPNIYEKQRTRTDPRKADTDGDGTPDGREDPDHDGLDNRWEFRLGTKPHVADSDRDGTPDGREDPDADRLGSAWEVHLARTDPRRADSDFDGFVDSVEDPDGDELSNAGEQRFGTDPFGADTDGDGTDDWHEDSNGDGIEDGLTQDRRRLPSNLKPSVIHARLENTRYDECHQDGWDAAVRLCAFGPKGGRKVVLFGDSHALHWRRAFGRIATARGWRVSMMSKSGCPAADFHVDDPSCAQWRESAIRRIRAIQPWLVIVSEYNAYPERSPSADPEQDGVAWTEGLTRTLDRLEAVAGEVVLLGDISFFGSDPVGCLKRNRADISRCSVRRSDVVGSERAARDRAAADAASVRWIRTDRLSCPYDPCPLVTDSTLMTYNEHHLTVRYGELVWRALARRLPK